MDYQLLEDKVLLKFLSISDELAFKEIYLRYWKGLYFSAVNKINNKEIAEDIIQVVFTALWEKREKHSIQNLSGYLHTAVKYQVINYIRSAISKKSHLSIIEEEDKKQENNADLLLLMQELNRAINNALDQLPQKTQTIFRLRFNFFK
jgi:RNA polymerase sigma factor (sigma-70 family)